MQVLGINSAQKAQKWMYVMEFLSSALTFIVPLLPALLMQYSLLSALQCSLILACINLITGSSQIFIGQSFDQGKSTQSLIASFFLTIIGIPILLYANSNIVMIITGAILTIMGVSIIGVGINRILVAAAPEEKRGMAATTLYLVHNIAICCAAIMAYLFLDRYRSALYFADMVSTASVALVLIACLPFFKAKQNVKSMFKVMNKKWLSQNYAALLLHTLIYINIVTHILIIPILFSINGLAAVKWTTVLLIINTFTVVCFARPITKLSKNIPDKTMVIISCALFGLAHAILPFCLNPLGIAITTFIAVLGEIAAVPPMTKIFYACFEQDNLGLAAGLKTAVKALGMFLTPILGLFIFSFKNHENTSFAITMALLSIAIPIVCRQAFKK